MSVKIRLKRSGSKKRPFYRVVVTDSRRARDSRSIEDIGYYNPLEDPVVVNIDRDKVASWTAKGALPTDTVRNLLKNENSTHPTRRQEVAFTAPAPASKEKDTKAGAKKKKAAPKAEAKAETKAEAKAEAKAETKAEAAPAEVENTDAPTEDVKVEAPKEAEADAPAEEPKAEASADEAAEAKDEKSE